MNQTIELTTKPTLEDVQREFEAWRKKRRKRSRIPEALWDAAVKLSSDYTTHQISKALRLNYLALEKRIVSTGHDKSVREQGEDPSFIEIDFDKTFSSSACFVEIEKSNGSKMKMYFKGEVGLDLMEFGKLFLENQL